MKTSLKSRIAKIRLVIFDVDGVLTDGRIIVDDQAREIKNFHVLDGFGIVLLRKMGFKTAIISARTTQAVVARARDLKIDRVCEGALPKTNAYEGLLKEFKLKDEQVCFMGDDLTDLCLLKRVGLAVTVPNGVEEVKQIAHYVTKTRGGHGAVRELVELIFKSRGEWKRIVESFSKDGVIK